MSMEITVHIALITMEFVSPEGLRLDGRRPKELRRLSCSIDVLASADGSAIFEMGNTKVRGLCYI